MTDIKVVEWNSEWPSDLSEHVYHMHGTTPFMTTVPAVGGDVKGIIFPIRDGGNVVVTKDYVFSDEESSTQEEVDALAESLAHHFDDEPEH